MKEVCNLCGDPLDIFDKQENLTISTTLGYGSAHDGEKLELRFCCACMDWIIDQCERTPIVEATND